MLENKNLSKQRHKLQLWNIEEEQIKPKSEGRQKKRKENNFLMKKINETKNWLFENQSSNSSNCVYKYVPFFIY